MMWEVSKLETVLDMYQPKTISQKEMVEDGKYPVFGANGQIGWFNEFNHEKPEVLLTCRGATCGFLNWSLPNSWINGNAMVMRPKDSSQLSQEFLFKALEGGVDTTKAITGSAQPQITRKSLNPLGIPIPPLEEQERIVEVLDEAFAAIDKAKANIERNLTNARELFQSRLNDIFSNPSEDWEVRSLGEISAIRYGHTDKSNADFRGPKFLRITDIQDGVVNWESVPRCNPMTEQDWAKYELRKGDIVFARTGATTGKSFLLPDVEDAVFASYLIRVRLHQLDAAPFVALFFESPEYWAVVAEGTTGSAQGGFNAKKLSSLSIPLPPREVQAEVIMELSELRRNVRNLEDGYQAELNSLEELRQSILEQAFEGKLTEPVAA